MDLSRLLGIFAIVIQIGNLAAPFLNIYAPDVALIVAGVVAAIQAFTGRVQGSTKPTK